MAQFTGTFELTSSENFDAYLSAVGVGIAKRAVAAAAKPTLVISENGGRFTLKTLSAFKNTEIVFALGEEFDEETADGRKSRSTVTAEGNKLIHTQKIGGESSTTVREFKEIQGNELKATFTAKGVVATRTYKKVA